MILISHIALSVVSLLVGTIVLFSPSKLKLRVLYVLTLLAIGSGVVLGINSHADLTRSCISGSIYLAVIVAISFVSRRRLALKTAPTA